MFYLVIIIMASNSTMFVSKGTKRCWVAGCNNDQRYPKQLIIKSHVIERLTWHYFPTDEEKRKRWAEMVSKGRENFNPGVATFVCSNHFLDRKPTMNHPCPALFLTVRDRKPPAKRKSPMEEEKPKLHSWNFTCVVRCRGRNKSRLFCHKFTYKPL